MTNPPGERLARLSRTATLRAAALTGWADRVLLGVDGLAAVLYRAGGCAPPADIDPRWPQLLLRRAERPVRVALNGYTRSDTAAWLSWTQTDADVARLVHKIYVSPAMSDLAHALPVTFAVAADLGVPGWKVGADVAGIHRADKIVLYLPTEHEADEAASALVAALEHSVPQGVPFTGQVGDTGVVSRGLDHDGTSWRAVVCRELAEALWSARVGAGPDASAETVVDDAYDALAGSGYDVFSWRPVVPRGASPVPAGAAR
ncbi:MAG: hypothetical protein ABI131_04590 [Nostocoides sp.]